MVKKVHKPFFSEKERRIEGFFSSSVFYFLISVP